MVPLKTCNFAAYIVIDAVRKNCNGVSNMFFNKEFTFSIKTNV